MFNVEYWGCSVLDCLLACWWLLLVVSNNTRNIINIMTCCLDELYRRTVGIL